MHFFILILTLLTLPSQAYSGDCDLSGIPVSVPDQSALMEKLRISKTASTILDEYQNRYGTHVNQKIFWGKTSYSQILDQKPTRSIASIRSNTDELFGSEICISLAKDLPEIEHLADLIHELTHAARLSKKALRGDVKNSEDFVYHRIEAPGGEADAFATECQVKFELLEKWDHLCSPYVENNAISMKLIVKGFYDGKLSASLTGETYPELLRRQFRTLSALRKKK